MDALTRLIEENAWRFPKGYPDINDKDDMKLLNALVEATLHGISLTEAEEVQYDAVIKNHLGVDEIPKATGDYPWKDETFRFQVSAADLPTFKKLYTAKPPKVGKEIGSAGSLAVGNGEIALYWLYQHNKNQKVEVTEGRNDDDPDLFFDGRGVEVKAYGKHEGTIALGRYGADRDNLALLSVIFGVYTFADSLDGKIDNPSVSPTNFKGKALYDACEEVMNVKSMASEMGENIFIKKIMGNIDSMLDKLGNPDTAEQLAATMLARLVETKMSRKPGDKNFLANLNEDTGDIMFFYIDFDKMRAMDDLSNSFEAKQSALKLNFYNIFAK